MNEDVPIEVWLNEGDEQVYLGTVARWRLTHRGRLTLPDKYVYFLHSDMPTDFPTDASLDEAIMSLLEAYEREKRWGNKQLPVKHVET